ncbi:MAG: tRNA (adenosine(37)-N6)-dimethylallyltransferase MiaA [Streptococcaceae bacterium]|jgi:tRNA dimethylallyltransferase|nr:tRNA (adenosine(37)-N6)-dimethylallyltransferase MiaA [Streptococcaceae bacterium]
MSKPKILVILGATAVGKTTLGIKLAQKFNGEIISGDSLQVYRKLDIGTAKATHKERKQVKHHLIDIRSPNDNYSVADFQKEGKRLIDQLSKKQKLPIIVGGTGLYIQALLEDFSLGGKIKNSHSRQKYEQLLREKGNIALWQILYKKDQKTAKKIHVHNSRRIMRALEILKATGKSIRSFHKQGKMLYDPYFIGVKIKRNLLYQQINARVEKMMKNGLLDEAKMLFDLPQTQAAQGIGYKEFFPYFKGEISLEEAIELVKRNSRRYAKRQMTWFTNRVVNINWYDFSICSDEVKIKEDVQKWLFNYKKA